jgi:peptide/nickel transport system substrate-binding protein
MKAPRIIRALATALAATVALAACSATPTSAPTKPQGPFTLRVNFGGFPTSWAPGTTTAEPGYVRVPYETLVSLDNGVVQGVLATSWEQSDQALTLHLRQGVLFHDGTPFDASAVRANLEYVKASGGQLGSPLRAIRSIDVLDSNTVRLNLSEPTPSILSTLSTRSGLMASPRALADNSVVQTPVGTGAWAYDAAASAPGTRMTFRFFDRYWGGREQVGFDTIELYGITSDTDSAAALAGGEIDMTELESETLPLLGQTLGTQSMTYPAIRNNVIFFGRGKNDIFYDKRMRQAACYAIDPHAYSMSDNDYISRTQHFAPGELGYNEQITGYSHDPEKARALYAEAGNRPVKFTILAAPFTKAQMEMYAKQLNQVLGWDVTVQTVDARTWQNTWRNGDYPFGSGSNTELTPYDWYKAWFAPNAAGNPSHEANKELDEAAQKAIAAGSSPNAAELWAEVTKIIFEEALTCGHMAVSEVIAWNSGRVTNVSAPRQPWEQNLVNFHDLRPVA